MNKSLTAMSKALPEKYRDRLARFHTDESGSMVVFTLFIIVLMLIIGGMAVDFMRFESRRAMMQGAIDSAVLAAADLDQNRLNTDGKVDVAGVVEDYLTKSQAGNCLSGPVDTSGSSTTYRSVSAQCEMTMNTFFLKLIGMNQLTAVAGSTAVEGVGEIEISLVVDISGSMEDPTVVGGDKKIKALRDASKSFVEALLIPANEDKISISLVPYSQHVNVGPDIFNSLGIPTVHNFSYCADLPASAYNSTTWSGGSSLTQLPHVQTNPRNAGAGPVEEPICPRYDYEEIIPISQNLSDLTGAIAKLQPRAGTSIFLGLKWGVTLLDPSFNSNVSSFVDPAFSTRPTAYADVNNRKADDPIKYLVLMTDGMNSFSSRIRPEKYAGVDEIAFWNTTNANEFFSNIAGWGAYSQYFVSEFYTPTIGDQYMQSMCTAARSKGIIMYGVGVYESAPATAQAAADAANGKKQLTDCIKNPANTFVTDGTDLTAIFDAIAGQITDLRLTL